MAALISSVMNTKDRVPFYVNACDEMGIEVLPPDVNESQLDFAVVEGKIRFGLNAVKNVGETAAAAIVRARDDGGRFASIWDFVERVDPQVVNKRALESLVKCGALDSTGASRLGLTAVLEQALGYGQKHASDRLLGQASIFDLGLGGDEATEAADAPRHHPAIPPGEFEKQELLRLEKEVLGLYVSEHPLHGVREQLRRKTDATLAGPRAPPRRRGRHGRRHRLRREAADDEARRADGVPHPRRPDRFRRGGRLQLRLRGGARAVRRRPRAVSRAGSTTNSRARRS